jgi:DDE superfamily endonuclease
MEGVLELYAGPPGESRPAVCVDELSKELHGPVAEPIRPGPGRAAREDYEYKRDGTAHVFVLLCPLLGWRHLEMTAHRGYAEFAALMKALADVYSPKAEVIRVVLGDLNPHVPGALDETFSPAEARRIARKLGSPYTPKRGSWLNRAELEFSVLSRQCLDRRIATADDWAREVAVWGRQRNGARTKIGWSFRVADARVKLQPIYPS